MLFQLEHWLINCKRNLQDEYEESRREWRKLHNIPDKLQVKGANVIPARYMK